jgi:hypothetical protein
MQLLQIRQLAQFSRNGTWGIQNSVKTFKNQITLSYGAIGLTQGEEEGREYRSVGYLSKSGTAISLIGPIQPGWDLGNTKPSHNIQKTSHPTLSDWYDLTEERKPMP